MISIALSFADKNFDARIFVTFINNHPIKDTKNILYGNWYKSRTHPDLQPPRTHSIYSL